MVSAERAFLQDFVSTRGAMEVTSSEVMNPFAGGGSNNLYRCFIDLSFRLVAPQGYAALIHQDGHLGDPKSGAFRRHWYARIAKHFEFSNKMTTKVFAEVHHELKFSLNIYRGEAHEIDFEKFTYAFLPSQIEDSYLDRDGLGEIPGIKNLEGNWDTRGHRDRLMRINRDALIVIHALTEAETVPIEESRLIQPYSTRTLDVFAKFAAFPKLEEVVTKVKRLVTTPDGEKEVDVPTWQMSSHWHESGAQNSGAILRRTEFRPSDEMIIQGPMFHVGNPVYKTPKAQCRKNSDYDVVDLTRIEEDYIPRTNYGRALPIAEYRRRISRCEWDSTKSHDQFYRVAFRKMLNLNSERSLIGTIVPPGVSHIDSVQSVAFRDQNLLCNFIPYALSIIADFGVKSAGRQNLHEGDIGGVPWCGVEQTACHRSLRLGCLTSSYADLWNDNAVNMTAQPWSSTDPRLRLEGPVEGPATWDRTAGLRTEFARRLALVEIDVLVSQALGLTLDQLIEIYRIYFPVLQENEAGTWYDQNGRIVWTCSKGLPGVGWLDDRGKSPGRAAWERILADNPAELTCTAIDDTMPGGPREVTRHFVGPFTQCDRIEDYKRAWAHFERLKSVEAAE
jgi:hypothetical protein